MTSVDLTKCQPGDRLRLRDGRDAVYLLRDNDSKYTNVIGVPDYGIESVTDDGLCYAHEPIGARDVVAIVHPTRAEIDEQRLELLAEMKRYAPIISAAEDNPELWAQAGKGTGIATSNAYFNAIARAEATHE